MEKLIVLMAGGGGERLWPLSRASCPKPFINMFNEKTLFDCVAEDIFKLSDITQVYLSTVHSDILHEVESTYPQLSLLVEPCARGTSNAMLLTLLRLQQEYSDAVIAFFPTDSLASDKASFFRTIELVMDASATNGSTYLIGVPPTSSSTSYGYIQCGLEDVAGFYNVLSFVEKPANPQTLSYVSQDGYFWNSGILVGRLGALLGYFKTFAEPAHTTLKLSLQLDKALQLPIYRGLPNVPFEKIILEHLSDLRMVRGDFGWCDYGNWLSILQLETPLQVAPHLIDCTNSDALSFSTSKPVVMFKVNDVVTIETKDILFVCNKNSLSELKVLLSYLRQQDLSMLL